MVNYDSQQTYAIADTIWQQLGAQRFALTTGSKPITYGEDNGKVFLLMSVGRNTNAINRLEVAYDDGLDTYDMKFIRKRGIESHVVAAYKGIYGGNMMTIFKNITGMQKV